MRRPYFRRSAANEGKPKSRQTPHRSTPEIVPVHQGRFRDRPDGQSAASGTQRQRLVVLRERLVELYMPKGTDLPVHDEDDLVRIARSLNNRPRETLGFMKPSEELAEFLALTG